MVQDHYRTPQGGYSHESFNAYGRVQTDAGTAGHDPYGRAQYAGYPSHVPSHDPYQTGYGQTYSDQPVRNTPQGYGGATPVCAEPHDYGEDDGSGSRPALGPAQWGGAALSLALIVGLGVWGYSLMMRDVRGVPVIRALEGSARILPDDPGGQLAMHQGLAVNSVTADGSAAAPADQYILAPSATGLTDEDQPVGSIAPVLVSYGPTSDAYAVTPQPALQAVQGEESPLEMTTVDAVEEEMPTEEVAEAPTNVMRSPIPKVRPAYTPRPTQTAPETVQLASLSTGASLDSVAGDILAAVSNQGEMAPSEVASGTRLVQFGAFQSEDIARAEWDRLSGKFGDLMDDKTRVIEKAESGGKTFYRLRALGFADASDANRFCAALTSMNAACVPTVQR